MLALRSGRFLSYGALCVGAAALLAACSGSSSTCAAPDAAANAAVDAGGADAAPGDAAPPDSTPRECDSNAQCRTPTSVCDTTRGHCVECLILSDCGHLPGTVCSLGACVCPVDGESWCAPASCVDLQRATTDCGGCGRTCFGACVDGACADPWAPTATAGAPSARSHHVAVWTGAEMVVWGGAYADCDACTLESGGIYDHASYSWRATSVADAPTGRRGATAVWTGTEMLVWGGYSGGNALGTGGRFNPTTNTWRPITLVNAPTPRYGHSTVWTGTEMIVWGGTNGATRAPAGARYDAATDQWLTLPALSPARQDHTAVWLGDGMVIYGGQGDDGVDPDAFLPTASVAGGTRFVPSTGSWSSLNTPGQPSARSRHAAVALGDKLVVWGGYNGFAFLGTGGVYDALSLGWLATNEPQPEARRAHTAVVLHDPAVMIIWGGEGAGGDLDSGGAYDPATNAWSPLPRAPSPRRYHTAVSSGTSMIVWGGTSGSTRFADGAVYTPR